MSRRTVVRFLQWGLTAGVAAIISLSLGPVSWAGNYRVGAVGGVVIDVDGIVRDAAPAQRQDLAQWRRQQFKQPEDSLNQPVGMRMVSLRALEAACQQLLDGDTSELPPDIKYLGGLQRIQYVFVYPESKDIVLAGPAEGWKVDDDGNVVGVTTGRPVLLFDDLLVALRTVANARQGGISCSINPTPEGMKALNEMLAVQQRTRQQANIPALEERMKNAFGPQKISLAGAPPTSHFARVLVAADYRMKRLAMNLDRSPVAGMPSYVELIRNTRQLAGNTNPRWWLACNYQPLAKADDGLAWELRGQGVKCLTEDDIVAQDGTVKGTGQTSPAAQKWADSMTEKFDEIAGKMAVFAELRNVMDLCVVAALIDQHELRAVAGCDLPLLTGTSTDLAPDYWHPPKEVPPQCSFLRTANNDLIVTASGGVQIDSYQIATRLETVDAVKQVRAEASRPTDAAKWWWN